MKTRGENGKPVLRVVVHCLWFVVLEGLFVALSLLMFRVFPASPEEQTVAKAWFNKGANRVAVRVFAVGFDFLSLSAHEAPARVTEAVARLPSRSAGCGQPVCRTIDFTSDTLFTLGLGMWLVIVLFAIFGPLRGVGVRSRIRAVVTSAAFFILCFTIRCVIIGGAAYFVDPFTVVHCYDPPLRFVTLSVIVIVGILHFGVEDKDRAEHGRKPTGNPSKVLVAALGVLLGCNGNLSNNTITINVGGGCGDVLPYLAILVMVAWSTVRNFRGRKKAEAGELPRVRVASVEEPAVAEIAKGIVPRLGGRPRKGRQPAFTQKAVAVLCGKSEGTVAGWENGRIKPPFDYRAELRVKGGVEFFDWVREYNAHNGVADIFVQIQKGNVVYTEGLTEREKGLVEEHIRKLRQG